MRQVTQVSGNKPRAIVVEPSMTNTEDIRYRIEDLESSIRALNVQIRSGDTWEDRKRKLRSLRDKKKKELRSLKGDLLR